MTDDSERRHHDTKAYKRMRQTVEAARARPSFAYLVKEPESILVLLNQIFFRPPATPSNCQGTDDEVTSSDRHRLASDT
jgi:hypothetical protein